MDSSARSLSYQFHPSVALLFATAMAVGNNDLMSRPQALDVERAANSTRHGVRPPGSWTVAGITSTSLRLMKPPGLAERYECFQWVKTSLLPLELDSTFLVENMLTLCGDMPLRDGDGRNDGECARPGSTAAWRAKYLDAPIFHPYQLAQKVLAALEASSSQIRTVIDVGCNMAQVALRAATLWPASTVWCVEPIAATLTQYCDRIEHKQIKCRLLMMSSDGSAKTQVIWTTGVAGDLCATTSERASNDKTTCYRHEHSP